MSVLACKTKNIGIIVKGHRVPQSVREACVALNEVLVALANGANNALKQSQGNNGTWTLPKRRRLLSASFTART